MKLRIKSLLITEVIEVANDITVTDLTNTIKTSSERLRDSVIASYKVGFPPRTVDANSSMKLSDAGILPNTQLLISDIPGPGASAEGGESTQPSSSANHKPTHPEKSQSKSSNSAPESSIPSAEVPGLGYVLLRNIPDDNSCMFGAISYCLHQKLVFPGVELRKVVADTIRNDPFTYNEIVLGRPIDQYCEWIERKMSWGGAIELGILADYLNIRINCFDVELGNKMVFQNESDSKKPTNFINLIYSGIHYDSLVLNPKITMLRDADTGCFAENEQEIVKGASHLVSLLQKKNYSTNTTTFRLRCLECYEILVGETGASRHANSTGHFRFGEVNK